MPDAVGFEGCASLDHLIGAAEQRQRHGDAKRLGGFEVDQQIDLGGLLDRQVGRLLAPENTTISPP